MEAMRSRFGNGQAELVTKDRIEAALTELRKHPEPTRRQLFVLAHVLAQRADVLSGRTILEAPIGERLLSHWELSVKKREIKPSHWRGLFHSYLQAEEGTGCQRLRNLLASSFQSLLERHPRPEWVASIKCHRGLLENFPCKRYVDELLEGKSELLDDLLQTVDIPDASWLWTELRRAIVDQVKTLDEVAFKRHMDHLLQLPAKIPNACDDILAATLARYAGCSGPARHLDLMNLALDAWGSPQLKSNRSWLLAGERARHMVCGWLAQEDLEDFYRLCKDAREVDDRRLRFWLRFTEQMGYTQVLLGSRIRKSHDPDIREFIESKKKRLGNLGGGLSTNNAILMQIGGWLFVEFSERGNACYAFPIADAAIELGRESYTVSELRPATKSGGRLLHMDGNENWESKFLRGLQGVGIYPDTKSTLHHVVD